MIRRTLSVISALFVALLLTGTTSAHASEVKSMTSNGVILQNNIRLSFVANASLYKITDAQGNIIRESLSGRVTIVGISGNDQLAYNTSIVRRVETDTRTGVGIIFAEVNTNQGIWFIAISVQRINGQVSMGYTLLDSKTFESKLSMSSPKTFSSVSSFMATPGANFSMSSYNF